MKTLATCSIALALWCGATGALHAQTAAPAAAPAEAAAPPAVAAPPAAEPAAAAPAAPADAGPPALPPAGAVAAEPPAEPLPDPALTEEERQRREADRSRIRLLLARARSERAAQDAARAAVPAPQPEPVRHGDAGAALALGFSVEVPWHTEPQFDLFSENDIGLRYGLWATYDVLAFGERTFLAAGAGFDVENLDEKNLYGALDTELTAVVLYGTAVVRHVLIDWLQPHARLSLGGQLVRSRMSFGDDQYNNDGDLPFGSLSAGFTLRTPTRLFESRRGDMAALSFGVMIEGGYTLATALEMKVDGPGPDERDIALIESELEDLDRSGPFLRISLVARFY
jgi:hypothetical protein